VSRASAKPSGPRPRAPSASGKGARRAPPREVRIIGGQWKRSKLPVADAPGLRPTPDRVRETLFNWLGQDLTGWRCLDAFAGSGALGFEAASRGAVEVVLLERDRHLAASLAASAQRLGARTLRIECADAIAWMARCAPQAFDLVFVDPPFDSTLAAPALGAAARIIAPAGRIYAELPRALGDEEARAWGLEITHRARAGSVHFHLLCAPGRAAPP
jgi:16S rRNA (guanine(966)-N(2))-methyltransferase RsmD